MFVDYKMDKLISYSDVDFKINFGVLQAVNFVQDICTHYFKTFGSDNPTIKKVNNAAWVVSKTKVDFFRFPKLGEKIYGRIYTTSVKPARIVCETVIKSESGENLIVINQESCTIDLDTRKLRRLNTIKYPTDMETETGIIQNPFNRFNSDFNEEDLIYEVRSASQDIDFNRHVNNTVYVRHILNSFSVDYFEKINIKKLEIHYIHEALEGEFLSIYRKKVENGFEFLIMGEGKECVRAVLNIEEK